MNRTESLKHKRRTTVLDCRTVYDGYARVDRYRLRHSLHQGGCSDVLTREVIERGHVSAVIPVDPVRDRIVFIEQFRPGALAAGWEPWLLECIAGIIEPGEDARDVARREALEEAGCEIRDLWPIGRFLATPGISSETVELFCGRTDSRGVEGIYGVAEEGEDIRAMTVAVEDAWRLLADQRIVNAITLVAMQWLAANYAQVKTRWR